MINYKNKRLVKRTTAIVFVCFIMFHIISCTKDGSGTMVGKWTLVNDSTYLKGSGILLCGHSNYIGTSSDYYNFTADGNLFIKKGFYVDTASYTVNGNQVQIVYFSVDGISFGANGAIRGPL